MRISREILTSCLLALFILAFVVLQLPGNSVFSNELQNAGHTVAFAVLTFAALIRIPQGRLSIRGLFLFGSVLMSIGILIELGQWVTGRGFSAMDIGKDLIGIVAGTCFYYAFTLPGKTKQRLAAVTSGSLILMVSLAPSLALLISKELSPPPPILVNFEQWGASHRIRNSGTIMVIDQHDEVWKTNRTKSAAVQFMPGRWPSIYFIESYSGWQQFGCFTFRAYNPQAESVTIKLRVDDPDLGPHDDDHMTVARDLLPGETNVLIPLEELREQALLENHPGEPLMQRIRMFMFYVSQVDEPIMLFVDDIALGCQS